MYLQIDCTRRKARDILEYVMSYSKNEKYLENDTLLLRFACDGANISKNINSVRGVFKILIPRNSLPEDVKGISMSPEDEFTLFFYIGIFSFLLQFYQYTPNLII